MWGVEALSGSSANPGCFSGAVEVMAGGYLSGSGATYGFRVHRSGMGGGREACLQLQSSADGRLPHHTG